MLPNERFALERRAYYDSIGLVVDTTNGEFAHSPLTRGECDTGHYLLHGDHQHHGLLQSKDLGKCCFFPGYAKSWLDGCEFHDGWSELYDIYDTYVNEPGRKGAESTNREKDELGRSRNAVKGATKTQELKIGIFEQTPEERAAAGRKGAAKSIELGVGVTARTPEKMSEDGKKGGKASGAQRWHSTIDGFESNAAGVTRHNTARGWDPRARVKIE